LKNWPVHQRNAELGFAHPIHSILTVSLRTLSGRIKNRVGNGGVEAHVGELTQAPHAERAIDPVVRLGNEQGSIEFPRSRDNVVREVRVDVARRPAGGRPQDSSPRGRTSTGEGRSAFETYNAITDVACEARNNLTTEPKRSTCAKRRLCELCELCEPDHRQGQHVVVLYSDLGDATVRAVL
jgi:hypothetical protein